MDASIYFATQNYNQICGKLRDFQAAARYKCRPMFQCRITRDRQASEHLRQTQSQLAVERFKLFELGTGFAGRYQQDERFFMVPACVVRSHNSRVRMIGDRRLCGEPTERIKPGPILNRARRSAVEKCPRYARSCNLVQRRLTVTA
jgi:hypothetical protein